jgi:hypothetical protein
MIDSPYTNDKIWTVNVLIPREPHLRIHFATLDAAQEFGREVEKRGGRCEVPTRYEANPVYTDPRDALDTWEAFRLDAEMVSTLASASSVPTAKSTH